MLLRMSTLFLRTLREDPADAEVPSHRLLVRAGYIRRAGPGGYTWLPLGWRVLRNDRARSSARRWTRWARRRCTSRRCCPRSRTTTSNRWTEYGDDIFRLKDRKGADYLLGPTHEELFTLLVKDLYSSYKDLPLWIYQIQTKFRDEQRPRAGLLRGREFVMKDSYSFDVDDAGLDRVVRRPPRRLHPDLRPARPRLRDRLGAVRGDGRLASEEFLTPGRGRRGHLRPVHRRATTRPTSRPLRTRSRRPAVRRRARRARRGHPRHPDHRDARRAGQRRDDLRRATGTGPPPTR